MDSKQFAWLYLIKNGLPASKPSYYGGFEFLEEGIVERYKIKIYEKNGFDAIIKEYKNQIRLCGVNWSETEPPRTKNYSQFEGTFCDSSKKEYLEGTLVLLDGTTQFWCGENIQVTNVFDMMTNVHNAQFEFVELFRDI